MTYPDPTVEQQLIIAVAAMVPLVWAFTNHGFTRMILLVLAVPWTLFVARTVYMTPDATAPLELRLRWALLALLGDPLTIAWPAVIVVIFTLIRLFTWPRRRREVREENRGQVDNRDASVEAASPFNYDAITTMAINHMIRDLADLRENLADVADVLSDFVGMIERDARGAAVPPERQKRLAEMNEAVAGVRERLDSASAGDE